MFSRSLLQTSFHSVQGTLVSHIRKAVLGKYSLSYLCDCNNRQCHRDALSTDELCKKIIIDNQQADPEFGDALKPENIVNPMYPYAKGLTRLDSLLHPLHPINIASSTNEKSSSAELYTEKTGSVSNNPPISEVITEISSTDSGGSYDGGDGGSGGE